MDAHYRHCPYCGAALDLRPGVEHPVCGACGRTFYQNAKPCVGVIITDGSRVLLVKRGIEPWKGDWDIPGGFLGPLEGPEDAGRREVLEETGLRVDLAGFIGAYPDVYLDDVPTLTLFYEAAWDGAQPVAADDAVAVAWFERDAIPPNLAFACCRAAMHDWLRRGAMPLIP